MQCFRAMGCASSKKDISRKAFKVISIDSHHRPACAGVMEIIDCDLVLRRKDKPLIKWPLISLRKFGFVSKTFTFECGRRCPTGPGIYAFKCEKSKKLFLLVQKTLKTKNLSMESRGEVEVNTSEEPIVPDDGNSDFYVLDIRKHNYVNVGSDNSAPITYAQLDLVESDEPQTPSPKASKSYVVIDFEKTFALSQTANSSVFEEAGTRRTRHNSTLDE